MAKKFQKPTTRNQYEYNKQIERIERFARRYHIDVHLPNTPERVTKNKLDELKDLKGKKILEVATVDVMTDEPLDEYDVEELRQETINALDFYNEVVGDVPLQKGKKQFISRTKYEDNVKRQYGISWEEQQMKTFEQTMRQYRQEFSDIMLNWRDDMIEKLGVETFFDLLKEFEQEHGGIGKAEAYNLGRLAKWLNKFAERIDDPDVRQAAIEEAEYIQSDKSIEAAFYDFKKFNRKNYYKQRNKRG